MGAMALLYLIPLCLLLPTAVASADVEAVIPPVVEPPTLDVRANVMRMLDEARRQPAAPDGEPAPVPEMALKPSTPAEVPAGSVPAVDVRASIMQKLREEGRRREAEAPGSAARRTPEGPRARRPAEERPDWYEGTLRIVPPPNEAAARGDYVPVPHKTITVNSLEDLKQLRDEFEAGRRRKAEDVKR